MLALFLTTGSLAGCAATRDARGVPMRSLAGAGEHDHAGTLAVILFGDLDAAFARVDSQAVAFVDIDRAGAHDDVLRVRGHVASRLS